MIPAEFDYRRAASTAEAIEMLADNDNAKLLAGGHSLLPMMKMRLAAPALLIDISGITELTRIDRDGGDLVIGALVTHAAIAASPQVAEGHRALAQAAASIGDVQVRNCGTLGGSLAHADPAADYGAAALALGASVDVAGPQGTRSLAAEELFAGLLTTTLEHTEIITAVRFPDRPDCSSAYEKFAQPASGFAIAGVAACLGRGADGACSAAHMAVTGVSDRALRLRRAEAELAGSTLDDAAVSAAAAAASAEIEDVSSDLYAAEDYRRHLVGVLTARAIRRAAS